MQANRHFYVQHYTLDELRRKLREVEGRSARADTMEAALMDAYVIQEVTAAIGMLEQQK